MSTTCTSKNTVLWSKLSKLRETNLPIRMSLLEFMVKFLQVVQYQSFLNMIFFTILPYTVNWENFGQYNISNGQILFEILKFEIFWRTEIWKCGLLKDTPSVSIFCISCTINSLKRSAIFRQSVISQRVKFQTIFIFEPRVRKLCVLNLKIRNIYGSKISQFMVHTKSFLPGITRLMSSSS